MPAYDVRARAQAGRMLAPIAQSGKGQVVKITRRGVAEYQTTSGVEEAYRAESIDGTLILTGDKKFLLSPFNSAGQPITQPEVDLCRLELADGSTWVIKACDPLKPAGLVIMTTLQLRGTG